MNLYRVCAAHLTHLEKTPLILIFNLLQQLCAVHDLWLLKRIQVFWDVLLSRCVNGS
jgi:hypothetical protein